MTPPKAADMAGWGEPGEPTVAELAYMAATGKAPRRPSLLRRFMRWVWRRG